MTDNPTRPPAVDLDDLRRQVTELEAENAQLKGRGPTSRGNVELLRANSELRRQVEHLRAQLPKADLGPTIDGGAYLTIHEVASRLNTTAAEASRMLARIETRTDSNGTEVVAADRFEQFILDTAAGANPARFL